MYNSCVWQIKKDHHQFRSDAALKLPATHVMLVIEGIIPKTVTTKKCVKS